jgi:hypothetical protein
MPRGVYVRTEACREAHRAACRKRSAQESYKKAQEASWTPERRAVSSAFFSSVERTPGWRSKISNAAKNWHDDPKNKEQWEQKVGKLSPLERALRNRLKMYQYNAKTQQRVWNLTDEEARALFIAACYYCGHVPIPEKLNGIDRLENTDGYLPSNTVSCCWLCNRNKGAMSSKEFQTWIVKVYLELQKKQ